MKYFLTVREFAWLTTDNVAEPTLDRAQIPPCAFDWLCKLNGEVRKSGAALVQISNRRWLKLDNYVGVIHTPCGTQIEIVPKHFDDADKVMDSRTLLKRMIQSALDLPVRQVGEAELELFRAPLSEWVIRRFLEELDRLVKRGLRFEYSRIESEERYLIGQLDFPKQMRQRIERRHLFHIRYDAFLPDRAENRLLKLAVERASRSAKLTATWRLANELRNLLHEVPISTNVDNDFAHWGNDRGTVHYHNIKPWCELILSRRMPTAIAGAWEGMNFLFPMERLFERYVAMALRRALKEGAELRTKPRSLYLCDHDGAKIFRLEPDLSIKWNAECWILDTKWKRLDESDKSSKYGLSQSDFYQLFAYGQTYLNTYEEGSLVLIYPKSTSFCNPLPSFRFPDQRKLWVLPFDLESGELQGFEMASLPLEDRQHHPILQLA